MNILTVSLLAAASMAALPTTDSTPVVDGPMPISVESDNVIVDHETGGRWYYDKYLKRPSDPGYASGVTVGFGYDLRYKTKGEIARDWGGVCTAAEVRAMQSVQGMDGAVYKRIVNKVEITWFEALHVYRAATIPKWMTKTKKAYDLPDGFHPHRAGALVCNTFNRGTRIHGSSSRLKEKKSIYVALREDRHEDVPGYLEDQQRLWPLNKRLKLRRRQEGDLYRKGNTSVIKVN